jgi:hypothetical protein
MLARLVDQTTVVACAAHTLAAPKDNQQRHLQTSNILTEIEFYCDNMAMIHILLDLYFDVIEQPIDLRKFDLHRHATADLSLYESGGRIHLASVLPHTPAAKIKDWHTCVRGA